MKEWMKDWGGAGVCHAYAENDNHTDQPCRIELLDAGEQPIELEEINDGE